MDNKTRTPRHIAAMKQAKFLILRKGLSQKDVAKKLNKTENTIGEWVKKYGWIATEEKQLYRIDSANSLQDFMTFVNNEYPKQYKALQEIYNDYISVF